MGAPVAEAAPGATCGAAGRRCRTRRARPRWSAGAARRTGWRGRDTRVLFRNIVTGAGLPTSCPLRSRRRGGADAGEHDASGHPGVTTAVNHAVTLRAFPAAERRQPAARAPPPQSRGAAPADQQVVPARLCCARPADRCTGTEGGPHMGDRVRVGVVGTSVFARLLHLDGLKSHPQVELTAICGRDRERAAEVAGRYGVRGRGRAGRRPGGAPPVADAVRGGGAGGRRRAPAQRRRRAGPHGPRGPHHTPPRQLTGARPGRQQRAAARRRPVITARACHGVPWQRRSGMDASGEARGRVDPPSPAARLGGRSPRPLQVRPAPLRGSCSRGRRGATWSR